MKTDEQRNRMTKIITYGDGKVWTQQGELNGNRCLVIRLTTIQSPVNSVPDKWEPVTPIEDCECILEFKTLESARTLQDELNELIAVWSRAEATIVENPFNKGPQ